MATGLSKLATAGLTFVILSWIGPEPTVAQVTLDGTVNPNFTGRAPFAAGNYDIRAELGHTEGRNLFHSFGKFSLRTGESATFSAPNEAGIRRVISRVTGGAPSDIDGTLRSTISGADFYFINPAGVAFGSNARLDLQGSFHVSTADELRFADGAKFSATNPAASSFTVAAPQAFGFLGAAPAPLLVDRSTLAVPTREALSLVGGEVTVTAGNDGFASGGRSGMLRAEAGRVIVTAVADSGAVVLSGGKATTPAFSNVRLLDEALIDVSGNGGGRVAISGDRLALREGSRIFADNTGMSDGTGGVFVQAGSVLVDGGSVITADTFSSFDAGQIDIRAVDTVKIIGGGRIQSFSLPGAKGDAGQVSVEARRIIVSGNSRLRSDTSPGSLGAAGSVAVRANRLTIANGGAVSSTTFSTGDAGNLLIRARDVVITGQGSNTGIFAHADVGSSGHGGTLTVQADRIRLESGGKISGATFGSGDADRVQIETRLLTIIGKGELTGIFSDTRIAENSISTGDAGSLQVRAGKIEVRDGGQISSSTFTPGAAGTVAVNADELTVRDGGRISSSTSAAGDSGNVTVSADRLRLLGGGQINSISDGASTGAGGEVRVTARDALIIAGRDAGGISSGIFANAEGHDSATEDAGSVTVSAGVLRILDGGVISSAALNEGSAGSVTVSAERLLIDDAQITTSSDSAGGGEIQLLVQDLIDLRNSQVVTSIASGADQTAGSILIDPKVLVIDGSRIEANAPGGDGGRVTIVADNILVRGGDFETLVDRGEISATGGTPERAGTIAVNAPEVDLSGGLVVLEGALLDATSQLRARCGARRDIGASSFTGVGRGTLPPSPDGPLVSAYVVDEAAVGAARKAGSRVSTATAPADVRLAGLSAPCAPLD